MKFAPFFACLLLCFISQFVAANELPASDQKESLVLRILDNIDTIEFSIGNSQHVLRNPQGFDVATEVYDDGRAPTSFLSGLDHTRISMIAYGPSNIQPPVRNRYALTYDNSVDYEGLILTAISAEYGLVAEKASKYARINIGASLGTGFTRSESYSDSTVHPLVQASIHSRLSLWRFFIELAVTERLNFARKLDGRDAKPRLRSTGVSLGYRFK